MKNCNTFLLYALAVLLLNACGNETNKNDTDSIENPVGVYLDSRVDAVDIAKKSLKVSDKKNAEQEEQRKALIK